MRRVGMTAVILLAAGLLAACGGGDGGGGDSKEAWQEEHSDLVSAYSRDLTDALNTINQGQRGATTGSCTQVKDDGTELRKNALPVPNPAVDGPLRKAIDLGLSAADHCLKGAAGSAEHGAQEVEAGQRDFAEARKAMDEAEAAMKVWS